MESPLPAAGFLYWVGACTVAYLTLRTSYSLWMAFRVWGLPHEAGVGPELGEWAVVTGSTDGIGKSYAKELAKCGMKLVLISRSQDKLNQVSSEIREKFKVEIRTIAVDFALEDIYDKIKAGLAGLQIGVLVNNVGISYQHPEYFLEIADLDNMTQLVLPGMVERSKGVILNMSSLSGINPVPLLTLYSATKVFVDFFSRALNEEYKSKGIFVQSVLPYFVATKMFRVRKPTLQIPSSDVFVKSAMKTVGLKSRTSGYPVHSLLGLIVSILPSWLFFKISMNFNKSLRARAQKRAKKN